MSQLNTYYKQFCLALDKAQNKHEYMQVKSMYLGRKGILRDLYSKLASDDLDAHAKQDMQLQLSQIKQRMLQKFNDLLPSYDDDNSQTDLTLPSYNSNRGSLHPFSLLNQKTKSFFERLGFDTEEHSAELVSPYHNFTALNVPQSHPSRSLRDTFYLSKDTLLRTHTTCNSIEHALESNVPLKKIIMGATYRRDQDSTHTPMFHQIDCIWIDDHINLKIGLKTLTNYLDFILGSERKYRLRPSHFPFTEPSFELDMWHHNSWLEVLGCGMLHQNVMLEASNQNSNWQQSCRYRGFAFGMGAERLIMAKYGIKDIKTLYGNDIRFNEQFLQ